MAMFYLTPFLFILPEGHEEFDCQPTFTYLFQSIPLPYGLPTFETMPFLHVSGSGDASDIPANIIDRPSHSIGSVGDMFRVVAAEGCGALPIDTSVDPFNPSGNRTKAYSRSVRSNNRPVSSSKSSSTVVDAVAVKKRIGTVGRYLVIGSKRQPFIA
jgi:hypothetical protein